jgi:DNA-binding CsgD family transcriptional regulator
MSQIAENIQITPREVECLSLWLSGYSVKESAQVLKIAAKTVEVFRYNLREKLNIRKKSHIYTLLENNNLLQLYLQFSKKLILNYESLKNTFDSYAQSLYPHS